MGHGEYATHRVVAERAARRASEVLRALHRKVEAREKRPGDLVTDADLASERAIAEVLLEAFPEHTILAEEAVGPAVDRDNPWRWIVDPLDGTINFAHGFPLWCVSIALEFQGELVVGVVHDPTSGALFSGSRGEGATLDGRPLQVSPVDRLSASLITAAMPTDFAADAPRQLALMRRFSTGTHSLRRTGSSALNLALLAAGACEVFYGTFVHPWDVAAGVLLVREAGGTITDITGQPYRLDQPTILASNGRVHPQAVAAIAEADPGSPIRSEP